MSDFLPFAFLLGLTQLALCISLAAKARQRSRIAASGPDTNADFTDLQIATSAIGLMLTVTLLCIIKLPSGNALLKGDLDAWERFDFDLLACLCTVPAIGLIRRLRMKANIVSLLAAVAIIPSLGAIAFTVRSCFIGAA